MDWQTHTLPDAFTLPAPSSASSSSAPVPPSSLLTSTTSFSTATTRSPASAELSTTATSSSPAPSTSSSAAFSASLMAAGILLFIRFAYKALRHREGLGLGDIKLIAMITAFLGFWLAAFAVFFGVDPLLPLCRHANRPPPRYLHHPPPPRHLPRHRRPGRRHPRRPRHRLVCLPLLVFQPSLRSTLYCLLSVSLDP